MGILSMISWIKENHMTVIEWAITIVAFLVPLIISRPGKYKVVDTKNMFKGYIVFIIKAVFYYFLLVCISFWAGIILRIPYSWTSKKAYLIGCIVISGLFHLCAGFKWINRMEMMKKAGKYNRIFTIMLVVVPALIQILLYIMAVKGSGDSRHWIVSWTFLNFLVALIAAFVVLDYDFFEYQNVVLTLDGDDEKYEVRPEALHRKGNWIILGSDDGVKEIKFQEESIKKVEYYKGEWHKSRIAMKLRDKILHCTIYLCYLLIIGVASQFLFQAVIQPIVVTESQIFLKQGDYYQLEAVPLDPNAKELHYVSDSPAIVVSENGMVIVSDELSEDESISAKITISDDLGNTATVQVEVKNSFGAD